MRNILPSPELGHEADWRIECSTADPATAANVADRDDPLAQVPKLRNLDGALNETLIQIPEVLPDTLVPPANCRLSPQCHLQRRVPLHISVDFCQERFVVTPVVRLHGAFESLHVLLRHRPRIIRRWPRKGRTGTALPLSRGCGSAGNGTSATASPRRRSIPQAQGESA
jgi:hypothetical protein